MVSSPLVARVERASKQYGEGAGATLALRDVSLTIAAGEFVAVMGRSGCGKTTLLNLLGAMDTPTRGQVWLEGQETSRLDDAALTALRRRRVGFVFQAFHLLPTLSVEENIELPLLLAGMGNGRRERVRAMVERVELSAKLGAFPGQLSGGEMQRVAIARALVHEPALLIADEPTGNLDSQTAGVILDLLAGLQRERGAAVIMATHSPEAAERASRMIRLRDGCVVEEG
ncbi:MAG TPA: ABC transporter ATP-binding protein [Terriglobales bacterium]|nr:ABC transporter ATP-binding protein [Terriglobales bacterium]